MWSSTSSDCARAMTSSSLAKPMRLQEPRHESVWVEGQRNGCRYEKEQASHNLAAIQHHWLPVSVWYLPKIIKGTVRGQGSLTYYPYPYTGGNYQGSWLAVVRQLTSIRWVYHVVSVWRLCQRVWHQILGPLHSCSSCFNIFSFHQLPLALGWNGGAENF